MRKLFFLFTVLSCSLFSLNIGAQFEDFGLKAKFYEGRFFIYAPDQELAKEVGYRIRAIYEKVTDDIGHSGAYKSRYQILIWRTREDFLQFLDKARLKIPFDTVAAVAVYRYRGLPTVAGYLDKNLFSHSLPHEFTHLVSKELLGVTKMPLWLDEGLATYEEGIPLKHVKYFLREKIKNKN